MILDLKQGDRVKVKLGHDIYETVVFKVNKKTVWVKTLFTKTRVRALSPKEKEEVARMPQSLTGLSDDEKALALLARQGKKVVTERGEKIIKLPRIKVIEKLGGSEPLALTTALETTDTSMSEAAQDRGAAIEEEIVSKSTVERPAVQQGGDVTEEMDAKARLKAKIAKKEGGENK